MSVPSSATHEDAGSDLGIRVVHDIQVNTFTAIQVDSIK